MEGRNNTGSAVSTDRRAAVCFTTPRRTFCIILSIALLCAIGIGILGVLIFSPSSAEADSQLVRLTLQGHQDLLRNQTALVDKSRSTVTYYITSESNHTAVVLYDSRNADELLRSNNQTRHYQEFLGVLAGGEVDPRGLGEAVQALCEQTPIFKVRRREGEWRVLPFAQEGGVVVLVPLRSRLGCAEADACPRMGCQGTGDL
ncbi:BRICHOS domain-containing protein 5 isoform X3 [Lathamus discolor]|uniref:BRICHOS domain-containing protein 5 isoform X3 n=1 Tax=Lathamus discolor TaxID=678569 RepID=UPI0032B7801E